MTDQHPGSLDHPGFEIPGLAGQYLAYWTLDKNFETEFTTQANSVWLGPARAERDDWRFYHEQRCCESVRIVSIRDDNDSDELNRIVDARMYVWSDETPDSLSHLPAQPTRASHTWTVLHLSTERGDIEIVWLGESNGYYSEDISIVGPDGERVRFGDY